MKPRLFEVESGGDVVANSATAFGAGKCPSEPTPNSASQTLLAIISCILLGENYRTSPKMALSDNKQKMLRGELYYAFTPELVAARARCKHACARYNNAGEVSRRRLTELWRE